MVRPKSSFRIMVQSAVLAMVLCLPASCWLHGAKAGGLIYWRGSTGVHILLDPTTGRMLSTGNGSYLEIVPLTDLPRAQIIVSALSGQTFTSHSLTAILAIPGGGGTWNPVGSTTWLVGLSFRAYEAPLLHVLQGLGGSASRWPEEMIEVDEMDGAREVLLGTTYVRIGPGSHTP